MANEVEILTPALEIALAAWEKWKNGKPLLLQHPLDKEIVDELGKSIAACDVFKLVSGRPIFSGYSGVVLAPTTLSIPLLYMADPQYGKGIKGAIDWFLKVLCTRQATGIYSVAVWGIEPNGEVEVLSGKLLQPFSTAANSHVKRRIGDLMQKRWDGFVWHSTRYYAAPGGILSQRVERFPYLGRPDLSFKILHNLDKETRELLSFFQARITGQPIVGASWFCYEDEELDFNSHENHLVWCVPEVEPVIPINVPVDAAHLASTVVALKQLPEEWQDKVLRSVERFVLSQSRYNLIDRALDLAIAFEILTTGGRGDNAPPSWKVAVRSAQLIGGPLNRRLQLRDRLGELYKIRNAGSHGGMLKAKETKEQEAVIYECVDIYRALIGGLLAFGAAPDWPSIELEPRSRE